MRFVPNTILSIMNHYCQSALTCRDDNQLRKAKVNKTYLRAASNFFYLLERIINQQTKQQRPHKPNPTENRQTKFFKEELNPTNARIEIKTASIRTKSLNQLPKTETKIKSREE